MAAEKVAQEHRDQVAEGRIAHVGGYTAASDAELDLIESKLNGSKGKSRAEKSETEEKPPELVELLKQSKDALVALAAAEGATHEGDANKETVAAAIIAKRAEP